ASQSAQRRNPRWPRGSTRQTGPLARSSARSRLPSTVKLGLLRSRTGSASKPAGTGLFTPAGMFFLQVLQRRHPKTPPLMSHTLKHHSVCRPPQHPVLTGQATPAKQGTDREHSRGGQSQSRSHNATSEGGKCPRPGKDSPSEWPPRSDALGTSTCAQPNTWTCKGILQIQRVPASGGESLMARTQRRRSGSRRGDRDGAVGRGQWISLILPTGHG